MAMCGFTRCGVPEGLATVERFMRAFEVGDLTDGQCQGTVHYDRPARRRDSRHWSHRVRCTLPGIGCIARLADDGTEAVDGRVELPQRTLAAMLGVARPSLNKVLKDLERDGLIRIGYSTIEVPDRARLAARS